MTSSSDQSPTSPSFKLISDKTSSFELVQSPSGGCNNSFYDSLLQSLDDSRCNEHLPNDFGLTSPDNPLGDQSQNKIGLNAFKTDENSAPSVAGTGKVKNSMLDMDKGLHLDEYRYTVNNSKSDDALGISAKGSEVIKNGCFEQRDGLQSPMPRKILEPSIVDGYKSTKFIPTPIANEQNTNKDSAREPKTGVWAALSKGHGQLDMTHPVSSYPKPGDLQVFAPGGF